DGSAVEALHLAAPSPAPVRAGGILSSDVSLRISLGFSCLHRARRRVPEASGAGPRRALPGLSRPVLGRPLPDRGLAHRRPDAGAAARGPAGEPRRRRAGGGRRSAPAPPGPRLGLIPRAL